jgi:hypothetical protein
VARTVFLHIGLPKSGTTYVQSVLGANKQALRDRAALLYPGRRWADQADAVVDLCRLRTPPERRRQVRGSWQRLVDEMRAWPGDCVVSMEWLCSASTGHIERIVDDVAPAQVRVVVTARDVARTLPSAWQEFCRNQKTWAWSDFLDQVTDDRALDTPAGRLLWAQQDVAAILDRWATVIPADRTHLVTVPPPGADPDELWRRLAGVLGLDPTDYDATGPGRNVSLGLESAELVRRLNLLALERDLPRSAYNRLVKNHLAKSVLSPRSDQETKVVLPDSLRPWATRWADEQVRAIQASGVSVVGDLEELRPVFPASQSREALHADPDKVLDAAVEAVLALALDPPRAGRARPAAAGRCGRVRVRRMSVRELSRAARDRARRMVRR